MDVASVRETANFTNNTNAVTPYTLGQVLGSYATQSYVTDAIAHAQIDPSQVDLHEYAKKTDLPTKLSQLTNDDNYVQTVGGFIPSNLLPSYVDDVIEKANYAALPRPGEAGKIYVTLDDNLTYRWSGSDYVEISKSLALGTTSSTAYRGDYGDIAYQHSQTQGNPHGTDLTDMGLTVSAAVLNYLTGLDGNIMTKLAAKVDKAGDTMTGYLTLHHDPTQKMHAANKDYVDKEINGISVVVTQNVTAISELQGDVSGLTSTVGAQADTLVEVQSDVTGLKQTTDSHTTAISRIDQDISGISSTVEETQTSVTHLEASVNQLDVVFDSVAIFVLVDSDRYPQQNATYDMNYQCKFRGNDVDPDSVTITGSHTGITTGTATGKLRFTVATSTAIPTEANKYTATFTYVAGGLTWTVNKLVTVVTVLQGEQGIQGPPGEDAVSIVSITEYFYKSDSPTELTGGSWVTVYPGWQDGKYIWTKMKTVYSDTTYEETTPMCVTGATGSTGQQGVSITDVDVLYYQSTSATTLSGGSWETTVPTYEDGKFMWTKQRVTYSNGFSDETAPVCVTGSQGKSPAIVHITSSNGLIFKDTSVSTVLTVTVYYNDLRITNITELRNALGSSVYLQWKWKRIRDQDYGIIPSSDPRLSNDGFTLTLDVSDIDTQVTFICELISNESIQFEIYGSTRQNGIPTPTNPVSILCKTGDITETIHGRTYTFSLGSIELGAIGDYVDRIFKQDATWYLEKNTLRITLSGNEAWSTTAFSRATSYSYYYSHYYDSAITWNIYNGYSNRFLLFEDEENHVLTRGADISFSCFSLGGTSRRDGSRLRIAISKDIVSGNTTTFKTWLQNNETQFLVPLEEPIITEITDTTLLNQLNSVGN